MIVIVIIGILINIAIPNLVRAREQTRAKSCAQNLRRIESAKQQWAIDNRRAGSATPLPAQLYGSGLYLRAAPICPGNYSYSINSVDTDPACALGSLFPPYLHTVR